MGPYVEAGWPTGHFQENNKNGYGAGFGADIRLGKIGITGSLGFMHFGGRSLVKSNETIDMPSINAVPVRVGLKYRIVPGLYAKMESGVARFTGGDQSAIIFSPGIGVRLLGIDVLAKYETWKASETYSFWGLKAGINF